MASKHIIEQSLSTSMPRPLTSSPNQGGLHDVVQTVPHRLGRGREARHPLFNIRTNAINQVFLPPGPQLKVVSTMSSGLDHIDLAEVEQRGILLGNTPQVLDNTVADITVGLLISAARRFKEGLEEVGRYLLSIIKFFGNIDLKGRFPVSKDSANSYKIFRSQFWPDKNHFSKAVLLLTSDCTLT